MPVDDGVPAWMDDVPPPSGASGNAPAKSGQQQQRRAPDGRQGAPVATAQEGADFFEWLNSPQTRIELEEMLPSYLPATQFIQFAKEAALSNPRLLAPNLRPSLLRAIGKLAKMGLRCDGKEAALVPRYDAGTRQYGIVAQSMVWGIIKLGRLTGAIKTIRPIIVFNGETFEMEEGDEPRWVHKVDRGLTDQAYQALYGGMTGGDHPDLVVKAEDFFQRVSCAYCIITGTDGTVTKRWMSAKRIDLIRKQQGKKTPWYGPYLDEMIIKTIILYTAKHVDLDIGNRATSAFRQALLDEVGVEDFESIAVPEPSQQRAIGHETKLHAFETQFAAKKETADLVPAEVSPLRRQVEQALAEAKSLGDVEKLSSEPWFRDGVAALRAENEDQADVVIGQLVRRSEELGA